MTVQSAKQYIKENAAHLATAAATVSMALLYASNTRREKQFRADTHHIIGVLNANDRPVQYYPGIGVFSPQPKK